MAKKKVTVPANVVERNIRLSGEIMKYLLNHPETFNALPDKFELIILPDDDPEMRLYNLELLDRHGSAGKSVVFARLASRAKNISEKISPSIFVPVPIAV